VEYLYIVFVNLKLRGFYFLPLHIYDDNSYFGSLSGSGKTVLGNKLKAKYKNKIVVKDLDNLRDEFITKTYDTSKNWGFEDAKYQLFIDNFIQHTKKPLIFVGLNDNNWGENKNLYYNLHATHTYYIDIDDMIVVKQKCMRFLTDELPEMLQKDEQMQKDITGNNPLFVKLTCKNIQRECGTKETIKENKKWKTNYKKQGYTFESREQIYNTVVKILNAALKKKKIKTKNTRKATPAKKNKTLKRR
jgi:hypothetical protein